MADLILTNGKIFTAWDEKPWVSAVAVNDGRFLSVGDEAIEHKGPKTEVIDLKGKTVIPGLTDSHNHLLYYGKTALLWADLGGCKSIAELQDRLRAHDKERPSEWIRGIGFDHEVFAEKRFPTREDLDKVSREKPIFVVRLCGHAIVANSKAIELAGPENLPESAGRAACSRKTTLIPSGKRCPIQHSSSLSRLPHSQRIRPAPRESPPSIVS